MISVVIPLYNKAHTIVGTLKSVLVQTFADFEVVIVNDGSTDGGVEVIRRFTSDPRIRIIEQENQGVSVARNRGVAEARFDYIAFLDGDDRWLPGYLENAARMIGEFPEAGMYCTAEYIYDMLSERKCHMRIAEKYCEKTLTVNFFENPHSFVHTSATVIRKDVFNETTGFPPGMLCAEDFALFFSTALVTTVVYCGLPLSIYVGGVPGQTTSADKERRFALLKHVVNFYNLVYAKWIETKCENKIFMVFQKYELRHRILCAIKEDDETRTVHYLLDNLRSDFLSHFSKLEKWLYRHKSMRYFSTPWILFTKIIWRTHGYPRVGETQKKAQKYLADFPWQMFEQEEAGTPTGTKPETTA